MPRPISPQRFAGLLLGWYDAHGRDLPWRKTRNPYEILLSEVMLQQTQVPRVLIKWKEWLARFPTERDVAKASVRDVLLAWQGMGYNNRALRLKACCEKVAKNGWPSTPETIEELPGIGRYTAHAIACFAFGQRVPIVDVNVKLVYKPFVGDDAADDDYWKFATSILPKERFYDYNQALFDLGTVVRSGELETLPDEFKTLYENIERPKKASTEKLYGGHPMRLYRGALVQFLRDTKGHSATLAQCKTYLASKLSDQPASFVKRVADNLAKDGIVKRDNNRIHLA